MLGTAGKAVEQQTGVPLLPIGCPRRRALGSRQLSSSTCSRRLEARTLATNTVSLQKQKRPSLCTSCAWQAHRRVLVCHAASLPIQASRRLIRRTIRRLVSKVLADHRWLRAGDEAVLRIDGSPNALRLTRTFGAVIRSFQRQSCRNNGAQTAFFIIFVLRTRAGRTRITRRGGPLHDTTYIVLRVKTTLLRNLRWMSATRARVHHQLYLNEVARWSPRPALSRRSPRLATSRGSPRLGANGISLWSVRVRLRRVRSWIIGVYECGGMDHPRRGCPALPFPQHSQLRLLASAFGNHASPTNFVRFQKWV
jgi:hypothetical protein